MCARAVQRRNAVCDDRCISGGLRSEFVALAEQRQRALAKHQRPSCTRLLILWPSNPPATDHSQCPYTRTWWTYTTHAHLVCRLPTIDPSEHGLLGLFSLAMSSLPSPTVTLTAHSPGSWPPRVVPSSTLFRGARLRRSLKRSTYAASDELASFLAATAVVLGETRSLHHHARSQPDHGPTGQDNMGRTHDRTDHTAEDTLDRHPKLTRTPTGIRHRNDRLAHECAWSRTPAGRYPCRCPNTTPWYVRHAHETRLATRLRCELQPSRPDAAVAAVAARAARASKTRRRHTTRPFSPARRAAPMRC